MFRLAFILFLFFQSTALAQRESVVQIENPNGSVGLGVVVSVDESTIVDGGRHGPGYMGKIVTAFHNVEDCQQFKVSYENGSRAKKCRTVAHLTHHDLALVLAWVPVDVPPVKIASEQIVGGDEVTFFGFKSKTKTICDPPTDQFIFSHNVIKYGDSGGPVFNKKSELVGVTLSGWFPFGPITQRRTVWPSKASNTQSLLELLNEEKNKITD